VLLGAGAFAALGDFDIVLLTLVAVTASVCGDSVGYLIGRKVGSRLLTWLERRFISSQTIVRSQEYFKRRGALAIFLSRFLFSGLGGAINLLAGVEKYSYRRFLLYDVSGEALGAIIPLLLGYTFSVSWEAVGDILGAASLLALAALFTIYLAIRLIKIIPQVVWGHRAGGCRLEGDRGMRQTFHIQYLDKLIPYVVSYTYEHSTNAHHSHRERS
jgi:membrane-associated protein